MMPLFKKLTIFLGLIFFLLVQFLPFQETLAAGATLSVSPATGTFNKSCDFTLDVTVNTGGVSTDGTDAILFYDPTRFKATLIKSGTIYNDYPGNNIDEQNGKITISGLSSTGTGFSGSGILATINFTVLGTAPTGASQIKFDFDPNDKTKTTDSNVVEKGTVNDILGQVVNGNFTVGAGSCTKTQLAIGGTELSPTPATQTIDQLTGNGQTSGFTLPTMVIGALAGVLLIIGTLGLLLF